MILLNKERYYLLDKSVREVPFNYWFALSVIEMHVKGFVFVDNPEAPETSYILHPYGMGLLLGKSDCTEFNASFRTYALNLNGERNKAEWVQAYPNDWSLVLSNLFNNQMVPPGESDNSKMVELHTRVNFRFNKQKFLDNLSSGQREDNVVRTDEIIFNEMQGAVIPSNFWDSAEDFSRNGVGFSLIENGKAVATAFSSYWHKDKLELGIETMEGYRGKGYAQKVCSALIDYCIRNRFEPVWSCRLENTGSYQLALKLGFEPTFKLNYYKLCEN